MVQKTEKPWENGALCVAPEGRRLQNGQRPFFWLGDTAWLLFRRLNLAQADTYLENRRQKGYNVIQVMLLHKLPLTNYSSRAPFFDDDVTRPDLTGENSYWHHVDKILDLAEAKGLYFAMVPAWGENVDRGHLTVENVAAYTEFVAARYQNRPNIIWLVGGDTLGDKNLRLWDTMGEILRARCPGQLITFHPFGATSSSQWFHTRDWLDFNMFQSGHSTYAQTAERAEEFAKVGRTLYGEDNWRYVQRDLALTPRKPTVDGEPCYERIVKGLHGPGRACWDAPDIRRFAYWSVFAGAMGHTYGHTAVMQFHPGGAGGAYDSAEDWQEAIHHAAAGQMMHLRRLMETMDFTRGMPQAAWIANAEGSLENRILAFGCDSWLLLHTATGRRLEACPPFAQTHDVTAHWFDPASGIYSYIGTYAPGTLPTFTPPRRFDGSEDWVLVLRCNP